VQYIDGRLLEFIIERMGGNMTTIYAETYDEAAQVALDHDLGDNWAYGGPGIRIQGYE